MSDPSPSWAGHKNFTIVLQQPSATSCKHQLHPPLLIPMLRVFAGAANNDEKVLVGAFSVIVKLLRCFVSSSLFAARRPTAYFDKPKGPPCEVLKTKT